MTSKRHNRCTHCNARYVYQACGPNPPRYNSALYCAKCYEVMGNALKNIPRKFEKCWVPTNEVTLAQLQEWEEAAKNDLIHRVSFPLYNIGKDADDRPISITAQIARIVRDPITGKHYEYRYWPGKEDEVEISLECERNLQDGTTKPW